MTKPAVALLAAICFPLAASSVMLTACQPGAVEDDAAEATAEAQLLPPPGGVCQDPKGCTAVTSGSRSWYTGTNCTGTEYAFVASEGKVSWDGYGLLGNTSVAVNVYSERIGSGICNNATSTGFKGYQRIYRAPSTCPSACPVCQSCVNGACVPVGSGEYCGIHTSCASATTMNVYECNGGACLPRVQACTTTCDPSFGLCTGPST